MSLTSALSSAVSGLTAQSLALSAISENISNASTTAYKTKGVSFAALVTGGSSSSASSGVIAKTSQSVLVQGLVAATDTATNVAIQGDGYFVVASGSDAKPAEYAYSRNGSFSADADGYLVNTEGYYLYGYPTDADGNVLSSTNADLGGLEPVSTSSIAGTAKATTSLSLSANLPADAAVGATFDTSTEVIDSLGVSQTIGQTWTKTAANTWTLDLADPYATGGDAATPTGDISPSTISLTFNGAGSLASTSPANPVLAITGYTSGASNSSIALNLGASGSVSGLTQYSSTSAAGGVEGFKVDQDGLRYGKLTDISIDGSGLVTAKFDNGLSQAIYRIPVATFANASGLTHISGTVYDDNQAAGTVSLSLAGEGGAGDIVSSALESSTTDTAAEFNKMIVAQQAYSAAAQIVTAVDEMFDTLLQAVR